MDLKNKKKKKKRKRKGEKKEKGKNIVKSACVCLNVFMDIYIFFYDETAKNKEGFNILIGSRCRSTNLYGSCISKFR